MMAKLMMNSNQMAAVNYVRKAAMAGLPDAQFDFGTMLMKQPNPMEQQQGRNFIQMAAQAGHQGAMMMVQQMGMMGMPMGMQPGMMGFPC